MSETQVVWNKEKESNDPNKMHGIVASSDTFVAIQKRTFESWVNLHLAERNLHVEDLQTDLATGVNLINLLEVLSGVGAGRYSKSPKMRIQYFNNLDCAFRFLKKKLEVKVVNIGAEDLVDGNLRAILGLIWSLISKYSVRIGKLEMASWVKNMVGRETAYGIEIRNVKPDMQNGKLLGTVVHSIDSNAIDLDRMTDDNLENTRYAMECAKKLGAPTVLTPEDFLNPSCDEQSLMTYFSGLQAMKPDGPDVQVRAAGYTQGLYVDVSKGPTSEIEFEAGGSPNEHTLSYMPERGTNGTYSVQIFWKGKLVCDPVLVES